MLNSNFNRGEMFLKSAFLGFPKYALVCEACGSYYFSISDLYVVSRAHKLPCFAQSAHFCVVKHTNPRMDRQSDYSTPCAQAHRVINYY